MVRYSHQSLGNQQKTETRALNLRHVLDVTIQFMESKFYHSYIPSIAQNDKQED